MWNIDQDTGSYKHHSHLDVRGATKIPAGKYISGPCSFHLSTSRPPSLPAVSFEPHSCIPSYPEASPLGPGGGSEAIARASPDPPAPSRFCAFHQLLVRLLDGLDWGSVLHRAPLSAPQGSRHAYMLG